MQHRITGICCKIHQDLFDLSGVCMYNRNIGRKRRLEVDIFTDDPLKEFFDTSDNLIDIDRRKCRDLLSAEG